MSKPYCIDSDGVRVFEGDQIEFSYGIPSVHVKGRVVLGTDGRLHVSTPHTYPKMCSITNLRKSVGLFYKVRGKS